MPPLISIITPAFNAAPYLAATLDSMRAQTVTDWECVIVDDSSTDGTAAVAEHYVTLDSRFRFERQENAGPSAARNRGLALSDSNSRYITFMDSDDIWMPEALETLQGEIDRFPNAVGAHGLADFIDSDGRPMRPGAFAQFGRRRLHFDGKRLVRLEASKPTTFESLLWTCPLYPPGVLLARRSAYERAGSYDPEMRLCEDWDMALRLARFGELRFVNKVLLSYRRHGTNISIDDHGNVHFVRHLYRKTFFSPENDDRQADVVRRGWRAYQAYRVGEKAEQAKRHLKKGEILTAAKRFLHIPVHLMRYVRGYPTASGI